MTDSNFGFVCRNGKDCVVAACDVVPCAVNEPLTRDSIRPRCAESVARGLGPSRSVRLPFLAGVFDERVRGGRAVGRCG